MPDATEDLPPDAPLGRNRDFRLLAVSQGISAFGDMVAFTALPLLVLELTGSGVATGVVLAIQALTDFAFGMFAGALADRTDRKRVMVVADLGRALLTALVPISVLVSGPTMAVIVAIAAPLSILRSLFRASLVASIPAVVGRPLLATANGILESIASSAGIVGPVVAGVLAATIGPGLTLGIDAASFVASAVGLFLIRRRLQSPADRPASRIVDDIREGVSYVVHHPVLRAAILLFSLYSAIVAPLVVALAVRITRDLGQTESVYGIVVAAFGVGSVLGSLTVARMGRRTNVAMVFLGGIGATGAVILGVGLAGAIPAMFVLVVLGGLAESLVTVTYVTLRTASSPDELLGRVASTARVTSLGLQPIGLLAGGLLIDTIGGTQTILVIGICACLLSLAFTPVRALRTATLAPAAPA